MHPLLQLHVKFISQNFEDCPLVATYQDVKPRSWSKPPPLPDPSAPAPRRASLHVAREFGYSKFPNLTIILFFLIVVEIRARNYYRDIAFGPIDVMAGNM